MYRGLSTGNNPSVGRESMAIVGRSSWTHVRPRALSLSQTGQPYGQSGSYAFDSRRDTDRMGGPNRGEDHAAVKMVATENRDNGAGIVRRQGESCEWPRACAWPMKERRGVSEIAQSAMTDAAAAASLSNSMEWTPEAKVYTMNEEVDPDLPPDVELLAYFSDSPIAWRAHEHYSEDDELDEFGVESGKPAWRKALRTWFSKMWRYQGLG